MHILLGLLGIGLGTCMLMYSLRVREFVGTWNWAERAFGIGGTYTGIKLIGVALMILSFMYMTGSLEFFLKATILKLLLPGRSF